MARIRSFKPEMFTDDEVNRCSYGACWLWWSIWTEADDLTGCFDARLPLLRRNAFSFRLETLETTSAYLKELVDQGLVKLYQDDKGRELGWIPGWNHQRIEKPSKVIRYPTLEQCSGSTTGGLQEHSGRTTGGLPEDSRSTTGVVGVGSGSGSGSGIGVSSLPARAGQSDEVDQVFRTYLETWPKNAQYSLTPKRRDKIRLRLNEFGLEVLCQAIRKTRSDPWPGRREAGAHELEVLVRSREQVEKWLNFPDPEETTDDSGFCQLTGEEDYGAP